MSFDPERNPFQDTGLTPELVRAIIESNKTNPEALNVALGGMKRLVGRALHPDATNSGADDHFSRVVTAIDGILELPVDDVTVLAKEYTLKNKRKRPSDEKRVDIPEVVHRPELISFVQKLELETFAPFVPAGTEITLQGILAEAGNPVRLIMTKTDKVDEVEVERQTYAPFNELEIAALTEVLSANSEEVQKWAQVARSQGRGFFSALYIARLPSDNTLEIRGANKSFYLTINPTPHLKPNTDYNLTITSDNGQVIVSPGDRKWGKVGEKEKHNLRLLGSLEGAFLSELRRKVGRSVMGDKPMYIDPNRFAGATNLSSSGILLPPGKMGLGGGVLADPEELKIAEEYYKPQLLEYHHLLASTGDSLRVIGYIANVFPPGTLKEKK